MASSMPENPIRVGVIRCDTHGAYYSALMDDHDPLVLRQPMSLDQPARYTWQHGGVHFYFYQRYNDPRQMTVERVSGFRIVKLWDADRNAAEMLSRVHYGRPAVCEHFEQVSENVDLVFIADCNSDGGDHLELARPGLERGVATFIDKPLASTVSGAKAILDLADRHGAPVMSMSILQVVPSLALFAQRLPETGGVTFGTVQGGGVEMAGLIHAVSAAQHVFGDGVQTVRCLDAGTHTCFHLDFGGRDDRPIHGVAIHSTIGPTFHCSIYLSAYGPRRAIHSHDVGDFDFPAGAATILRMVRQMARSNQSPIDRQQTLECVAVAEAALKARATRQPVCVRDILR